MIRCKQKSFRHILVLISMMSILTARTWYGSVMSVNAVPLRDVYIQNLTTGYTILSDYQGEFTIQDPAKPGDTLKFSMMGYKTLNMILPDTAFRFNTVMEIAVMPLSEVIKIADRSIAMKSDQRLSILKTIEMGNVDNTLLLRHIPGMYIKSYGGPAGISSASLDGGPSSHTKILMAGFDLTSAQNGQVDISQIPAPLINSVSLIPVNISRYGSGAIDGVLAFDPWSGKNALSFSLGSFGHLSSYGMMNIAKNNWNVDLLGGYRQDKGDYSYKTFLDTLVHIRQNNDFKQYYGAARVSGILKNNIWFRSHYLESHQERGVAGISWSTLDTLSRRNDYYRIIAAEAGRTTGLLSSHLQLIYRDSHDEYNNPYLFIESMFRNKTYDAIFENSLSFKKADLDIIFENKFETMDNADTMYQRNTVSFSLSANVNPSPWLMIRATTHLDYNSDHIFVPTGEIGLNFPVNSRFLRSIDLYAAMLFRYPTFNDLYWEPGGNPALRPEKTRSYSLFVKTPLTDDMVIDWGIYEKRSHDLIVWMPQASYWTPKNIQLARQSGIKISLNYVFTPWDLSGKISWNETHSADLTEGANYGKLLRYAPERSGSMAIQWTPDKFTSLLQATYTGKKIVMYGYPEDTVLPPVFLINASMSYKIFVNKINLIPVLAVDNLTNASYETIQGYPEPGRTWRFTLSMEW